MPALTKARVILVKAKVRQLALLAHPLPNVLMLELLVDLVPIKKS
jgi:hypothetical protein